MNKKIPVIVGGVITAIIIVLIVSIPNNQTDADPDGDDGTVIAHESVWSGPIGVTQYKHKLGDDVFFLIRGLQPNEKGTIGVFTPEGILYKSFEYDGSVKSEFNQYFYPDTFEAYDICKPEQLVGIWTVVFADNSYPPLKFEMTDEWIDGAWNSITVVC